LGGAVDPFDTLFLCAEVTVAILGFSGIVVVFGQRVQAGTSRALFHTLFRGTLIPLTIIAIASILDAAALERSQVWRVCSTLHAVALGMILVGNWWVDREDSDRLLSGGWWIPLIGGVVALGLSIWNALSHHSFWPVLTVIWWSIGVSLFAFVGLIFSRDVDEPNAGADLA
jgi:hypothetical protein